AQDRPGDRRPRRRRPPGRLTGPPPAGRARGLRAPGPPVDLGLVAASTPAETAAAPGSTSGAAVAAPTLEHSLKPAYGSFERPLKSGGEERTAHGPVHRGAHPDRSRPAVAADPGPRRALPLGPAVHRD